MPKIKIYSRKDGFMRGGHRHSAMPIMYDRGQFTEEQIRQFKAEPMLTVEEIPDIHDAEGTSAAGRADTSTDKFKEAVKDTTKMKEDRSNVKKK